MTLAALDYEQMKAAALLCRNDLRVFLRLSRGLCPFRLRFQRRWVW